jgi:hypothetical protein
MGLVGGVLIVLGLHGDRGLLVGLAIALLVCWAGSVAYFVWRGHQVGSYFRNDYMSDANPCA